MSKTNLASSIETTEELIRRYNESVCNMLADPQVLAYILVHTIPEYEGWDIRDAMDTIEDIEVRKMYVDPGYSNMGRIVGDQTVDLVPGEGEIRYDIRFTVNPGEKVRLLINVEAQKNTEFFKDDYDSIRKVVSIWICMDADKDEDGITRFAFKPEILYGKEVVYEEFNKMEAYIIRIRKSQEAEGSKHELIHMLETLLSTKKKEDVKRILQDEHGMIMEISGTEKEVDKMCNLGEALFEEAVERGIERGIDAKLIEQISSKLKKGKDIPTIAEEIEEPEERVLELIEKYKLA